MKKVRFEIIHEDEQILVVNKPPGMAAIPERFVQDDSSVLAILRKKRPDLMTVHRIDKDTSGLLIFAQNADAHRNLSIQFEKREVDKTYLTIVHGKMPDKEGQIDLPIAPDRRVAGKMMVNPKGKSALTLYKVIEEFRHYSVLEVQIVTGRTHQIRVHMAFVKHPLMIDELYGPQDAFNLSSVKKGYNYSKWENEKPLMSRLSLHAWKMTITHPGTSETVSYEAPIPKDLKAVINQLGKWDAVDTENKFY